MTSNVIPLVEQFPANIVAVDLFALGRASNPKVSTSGTGAAILNPGSGDFGSASGIGIPWWRNSTGEFVLPTFVLLRQVALE